MESRSAVLRLATDATRSKHTQHIRAEFSSNKQTLTDVLCFPQEYPTLLLSLSRQTSRMAEAYGAPASHKIRDEMLLGPVYERKFPVQFVKQAYVPSGSAARNAH